jgi:DNA polymerase III epsilon subunit-like protein
MRDVMVDLETLGQRPGSVIVSIGAVQFSPATGWVEPGFYSTINIVSSLNVGATTDHETLDWWRKQKPEARGVIAEALASGSPSLRDVLATFSEGLSRIGSPHQVRVWGNGANFDNALLAAAFRQAGLPVPWRFWNDRCFRTLKSLFPGHEPTRQGVHHNALDDAAHQARWAINIFTARRAV